MRGRKKRDKRFRIETRNNGLSPPQQIRVFSVCKQTRDGIMEN